MVPLTLSLAETLVSSSNLLSMALKLSRDDSSDLTNSVFSSGVLETTSLKFDEKRKGSHRKIATNDINK